MTNPIFTTLVNSIREAEAEAARLSSIYSDIESIKGAERRLAMLRSNEEELTKILNDLAKRVDASRTAVAEAEAQTKNILQTASNEGGKIISAAHEEKRKVLEALNRQHSMASMNASKELAELTQKRDAAKVELAELNSKLADGEDRLARLKKAALAFAGG